uniref:MSP domain-containing protein n=2 Tax=Lotharella globosa TaxID=91324 RepID=A0A7S3YY57_9EUKA
MESHVRVEPSSLRIELMLNKKCQRTLQIHNVSQKLVAYKVKTTKPERYFVGNNHGIIQPGGVGEVKILVEAMASLPENETKDKFLVMHMPLDSAPASLASHWKEMERKNKERKGYYYHSQKIKCRLTLPASHTAPKKMVEELKPDNFSTNTNPPAYDQAKGKGYDEAARDTANSRQDARMIEVSEIID